MNTDPSPADYGAHARLWKQQQDAAAIAAHEEHSRLVTAMLAACQEMESLITAVIEPEVSEAVTQTLQAGASASYEIAMKPFPGIGKASYKATVHINAGPVPARFEITGDPAHRKFDFILIYEGKPQHAAASLTFEEIAARSLLQERISSLLHRTFTEKW